MSSDFQEDYAHMSDQVLLRLVSMRRAPALDELYRRYSRLVFGIALQMLNHDHAAAEEVTLDIFTRAWQRADTYRAEKAKVSTWLGGMTRNRCIDRLRHDNVRPEGHLVAWESVEKRDAANPDPAEAVELAQQRERVQHALHTLPTEQRQVLLLAFYGDRSHSEIAEEMGLPLGTVKTRIRLGMQKLRSVLEGQI